MTEQNQNSEQNQNVKDLEQDEAALTLCAGATLAETAVMMADVSIKASGFAAGLPDVGVMYLAGLLLITSGGMTLSYIARQHTLFKIKALLEAANNPMVQVSESKEPVPASA